MSHLIDKVIINTERINFKVSKKLKDQIKELAELENKAVAKYIKDLIRKELYRLNEDEKESA